jgi:hypothetical protein
MEPGRVFESIAKALQTRRAERKHLFRLARHPVALIRPAKKFLRDWRRHEDP